MTQTIVNLGTGGAVLNGRNGSTTGADSNDALFLDWLGNNDANYVYLPGVNGNWMTTPHVAAFEIVDDLDIIAHIRPTIGSNSTITRSGTSASTTTFHFQLLSTGAINLQTGTGVSESISSSAVIPTASGEPIWVRVTRNKTAAQIIFYTGTDGVNWTQLGLTRTYTGNSASTSGETLLRIGASSATSAPLTGDIYQLIIKSGIDGTTVFNMNTNVITTGAATSFTALTGQTVTINRSAAGRKTVAVVSPVWLFGTDDYMEIADNALIDFGASDSFTVVAAYRAWATLATNVTRVAKKANTTAATQGWLLGSDGTTATLPRLQAGDGANGASATGPARTSGALTITAGVRNVVTDTLTTYLNGTAGTSVTDTTTASLANSEVVRIGRLSGAGTGYADMELLAVAVFRRALTPTEITTITAYYQARLS